MRKRQKIPCSPSNRRITQDQSGLNRRNSRLRAGTKVKMEMDRTAEEAECLETVQMGPAADSHQETNVTPPLPGTSYPRLIHHHLLFALSNAKTLLPLQSPTSQT